MKKVLRPNAVKILVIALLVLLAVFIATSSSGGAFLANIFGLVTTPVQKVSASVTDGVAEFLNLDSLTMEELKEYSLQIQAENEELKEKLIKYYDMEQENQQLKDLLGLQEEAPQNQYTPASVIMRSPGALYYGFSIDKGSLAGVSAGDPVITGGGLVGRVKEVYATTSIVETIFSEDLKVAAFSKEHDESGVLSSDLLMADSGLLRLSILPSDTKITEKTIITTSGAGGSYPENLIIGYVTEVRQSEYDVSKYAIVKPYADIKGTKDVFVITDFPGKGEEAPDLGLGGTPGADEDPEAAP